SVQEKDHQLRRKELRPPPTLNELVRERYLPHIKTYKRSWGTDETLLRIHILPVLGAVAVDESTSEAIGEIIRKMRETGYASGTTNRVLVLLRYIYNLGK